MQNNIKKLFLCFSFLTLSSVNAQEAKFISFPKEHVIINNQTGQIIYEPLLSEVSSGKSVLLDSTKKIERPNVMELPLDKVLTSDTGELIFEPLFIPTFAPVFNPQGTEVVWEPKEKDYNYSLDTLELILKYRLDTQEQRFKHQENVLKITSTYKIEDKSLLEKIIPSKCKRRSASCPLNNLK